MSKLYNILALRITNAISIWTRILIELGSKILVSDALETPKLYPVIYENN